MNKTHRFLLGAAAVAVFAGSPAYSQGLGGGIGGAVNGTLSGGMGGVDAMTRGSAAGALELDAHRIGARRDTTEGVTSNATHRTRKAAGAVRARTGSMATRTHEASLSAASNASEAVEAGHADAAGTMNSAVDTAGTTEGTPASSDEAGLAAGGALSGATDGELNADRNSAYASAHNESGFGGDARTRNAGIDASARSSSSVDAGASVQR